MTPSIIELLQQRQNPAIQRTGWGEYGRVRKAESYDRTFTILHPQSKQLKEITDYRPQKNILKMGLPAAPIQRQFQFEDRESGKAGQAWVESTSAGRRYGKNAIPPLTTSKTEPVQLFENPFAGYIYRNAIKPYSADNDFTLHHMVPGNKITVMLKGMAAQDLKYSFMNILFQVMLHYKYASDLKGINSDEISRLYDLVKHNLNDPEAIRREDAALLWNYIIWYPRNLVQGPHSSIRVGDPGEKYDVQAAESIGISSSVAHDHATAVDALTEYSPVSEVHKVNTAYLQAPMTWGPPHKPRTSGFFQVKSLSELHNSLRTLSTQYPKGSQVTVTADQQRKDADERSTLEQQLVKFQKYYSQQQIPFNEADLKEVRELDERIRKAQIKVVDSRVAEEAMDWGDLFG